MFSFSITTSRAIGVGNSGMAVLIIGHTVVFDNHQCDCFVFDNDSVRHWAGILVCYSGMAVLSVTTVYWLGI